MEEKLDLRRLHQRQAGRHQYLSGIEPQQFIADGKQHIARGKRIRR